MWMLLVIMLLTACSDHSDGSSEETEDCFLNIYVYAPERPMLTRADVGDIASRSVDEHMVHTLQIWVFKHSDGSLVGYLETEPTFLNETNGQEMFQMKVEKEFADHPVNVDVYVVANAFIDFTNRVKNYDLIYIDDNNGVEELTLDENTTRAQLEGAKIGEGSFGVKLKEETEDVYIPAVSSVPAAGLPMSGVLKNQPIYGSYPTLRVGTQTAMATLQLTRAISKLRFVLCRKTEVLETTKKSLVSIDGIQLDREMIPTEIFLMSGTHTYSDYVDDPIVYVNTDNKLLKNDIPEVPNPMVYAYETQSAQEYENLINTAIDGGQLTEIGLTYLRESDKQLTGSITYRINERENLEASWQEKKKTAEFSMATEGDFLRNRSWIIYIYFMDGTIHVLTVTHLGMKVWATGETGTHEVYNW